MALTLLFLPSCKISCENMPVHYVPLVLPVRVEPDSAELKKCLHDVEYWKDLAIYYRDEPNSCQESSQ